LFHENVMRILKWEVDYITVNEKERVLGIKKTQMCHFVLECSDASVHRPIEFWDHGFESLPVIVLYIINS
jgi:hypothetical protein